ncbi:MAG: hypothetical protein AUK47_15260 [Deltaproteobacteria bacterium CG2_30_63_29]|nr:MAG: hypothetical protein AUK47_15260 [Deltaproteobacteria bacterium CG2_30_63_29]PIW01657.1 MAG: hypothetical protein COW42_04230 [Deltaproteobacteria bacterium CG17_big_fil_post_rev_8_21_14_2_50_63_7]PJB40814.1 MAG: hypothetical protein CO108_14155 [Deltaproteobacteria bacterium CG_4_9_14_3_um_filter_63_12]
MNSKKFLSKCMLFVVAAALLLASGCELDNGNDADASNSDVTTSNNPTSATITFMAGGALDKTTVTVAPRANVTFVNNDSGSHIVDFGEPSIPDTGEINPGASATVQMPSLTGTYGYNDLNSTSTVGKIIVQ